MRILSLLILCSVAGLSGWSAQASVGAKDGLTARWKVSSTVSPKIIAGTIVNGCFTQGSIADSDGPLDIAIAGEGWIPLQSVDGEIVYTRYGRLVMDDKGFLSHAPSGLPAVTYVAGKFEKIDLAGHAVRKFILDRKDSTAKLNAVTVSSSGSIDGLFSNGQLVSIGQIQLAAFENQRALKLISKSEHTFAAPSSSGEVAFVNPQTHPVGQLMGKSLETVPTDRYSRKCL
ncbi:MAG: flagellar hook basal-body protein [Proteobacteria bacterium]|nr:MAG: flagellar hook basal-body protein [Pseudomonadota bacterium]